MTTTALTVLDQGLIDPETMDRTAIMVRQARSLLERVELPCGFPGCSYCDPDAADYRAEWSD